MWGERSRNSTAEWRDSGTNEEEVEEEEVEMEESRGREGEDGVLKIW